MILRAMGITIRLLLSGAAGLAITVGLAWRSALTLPTSIQPTHPIASPGPASTSSDPLAPEAGSVAREETPTATRLRIVAPVHLMRCGNGRLDPESEARFQAFLRTIPSWDQITPGWAKPMVEPVLRSPAGRDLIGMRSLTIEAHGWPARALYHRVTHEFRRKPFLEVTGGLFANSSSNAGLVAYRGYGVVLPCTPIYGGLILDSTILAVPWCMLFFGAGPVRRALRRRRNLCPSCGYSLAGLVPGGACPECGRARR